MREAIPVAPKVIRKRRAYTKSRRGCRNCKLRRVKCDESKPKCSRCNQFGVLCNYDPAAADLEVLSGPSEHVWSLDDATKPLPAPQPDRSPNGPILRPDASLSPSPYSESLASLERFRSHAALSLGNTVIGRIWAQNIMPAAFLQPFLMHTILATTAVHDRYRTSPLLGRRSASEAQHWFQGIKLFNEKLSQPIQPDDRDPLWATAGLLSILSFSSIEAATPEEAWPLSPPQPNDLEWISLGEGKMAVWHLTDPLRPGSVFQYMADEYAQLQAPVPESGAEGIPRAIARLCNLDAASTPRNNPYFKEAHVLARLLKISKDNISATRALNFSYQMQSAFKGLLRIKDPVALLLLALWYARVGHAAWWMNRRATIECQAICLYLSRFHSENARIIDLLPRMLKNTHEIRAHETSLELGF